MKLYASPASSTPIFHFLMKGGKDGNVITAHYGPYEHVEQDCMNFGFWIMLLECSMLDLQV